MIILVICIILVVIVLYSNDIADKILIKMGHKGLHNDRIYEGKPIKRK